MSIINEVDLAHTYHSKWYKNILRNLVTNTQPDTVDLQSNAHELFDFGIWYKKFDQTAFMKENSTFQLLAQTHYRVHAQAAQLLQKRMTNQTISTEEWDQFDLTIDEMQYKFKLLRSELLEKISDRDPLTKARNRTTMLHTLRQYHALYQKDELRSALIMFDLDHFKKINDTYGHAVGDEALIAVVKWAKQLLRSHDFIYRYGGEEFLLLMPDTNLEQAQVVAERLRVGIAELRIPFERFQTKVQVTASFGVTAFTEYRTVEESIDLADEAMYKAKAAGRNKVIVEV